jgi:hypothetical protein
MGEYGHVHTESTTHAKPSATQPSDLHHPIGRHYENESLVPWRDVGLPINARLRSGINFLHESARQRKSGAVERVTVTSTR